MQQATGRRSDQFTCPVHQEGGDAVGRCEVVRGRVQRRQLLLVPAQELHEAAEHVLHVCVVTLEVRGQEVGVPSVLDAAVFVANGDGVKRGDEVVPSLQTYFNYYDSRTIENMQCKMCRNKYLENPFLDREFDHGGLTGNVDVLISYTQIVEVSDVERFIDNTCSCPRDGVLDIPVHGLESLPHPVGLQPDVREGPAVTVVHSREVASLSVLLFPGLLNVGLHQCWIGLHQLPQRHAFINQPTHAIIFIPLAL